MEQGEKQMIYRTLHATQQQQKTIEQHEPQVLRKGKQFLVHMWYSTCYSYYKSGDMSWMRKWSDWDYDKRNISVVICDTDNRVLNFFSH
jgi:hypothetical protein